MRLKLFVRALRIAAVWTVVFLMSIDTASACKLFSIRRFVCPATYACAPSDCCRVNVCFVPARCPNVVSTGEDSCCESSVCSEEASADAAGSEQPGEITAEDNSVPVVVVDPPAATEEAASSPINELLEEEPVDEDVDAIADDVTLDAVEPLVLEEESADDDLILETEDDNDVEDDLNIVNDTAEEEAVAEETVAEEAVA